MIDTNKTEIVRLFVDKKQDIEGKTITLSLFADNAENEGVDVCANCLQEKILTVLGASGINPAWKGVQWHQETMTKKDGSGTYSKNVKTVKSVDEITLQIKTEKANTKK